MRLSGESGNILEIKKAGLTIQGRMFEGLCASIYDRERSRSEPFLSAFLMPEEVFDLYYMFRRGKLSGLSVGRPPRDSSDVLNIDGVVYRMEDIELKIELDAQADEDFPGEPPEIASTWVLVNSSADPPCTVQVYLDPWQGELLRDWLDTFVYDIIHEAL